MKAAVFEGPGRPLAIKDVPAPEIGDAEMLVRVRRCGICGTDIHASREGSLWRLMAPSTDTNLSATLLRLARRYPSDSLHRATDDLLAFHWR